MFALVEVFVLQVQVQREAKTISLSEIPLVLGLFSTGIPGLFVARVVGPALAFVFHRRQRNPVKLAFNLALMLTDLMVAMVVFRHVVAGSTGVGARSWVASYCALAVFGLLDAVSLSLVIGLYERNVDVAEMARGGCGGMAMSMAVGTLGLVAVMSLEQAPQAAWVLGVSAIVLTLGYRAYARLSERH